MTPLFQLILLPLRAPMLLLLLLISVYLGLHWSRPIPEVDPGMTSLTTLIWSAECLQALVVVVVCTIPELLLQRLSSLMAASRVASLVVTLLLVITGGLYLLHLEVLSNVLILASAVLLARLDLVRLRVVPPPFVMTLILSVLVLGGVSLGRSIEAHLRPLLAPIDSHPATGHRQERPTPAAHRAPELQPAGGIRDGIRSEESREAGTGSSQSTGKPGAGSHNRGMAQTEPAGEPAELAEPLPTPADPLEREAMPETQDAAE